MRILITHGYLLTGTGSNLYVNNLVRELCKADHDVLLVCQDDHPEAIDYVSDVYGFHPGNTELVKRHSKATPYTGTCCVFFPSTCFTLAGNSGRFNFSIVLITEIF